jgi:hypothetical protein
MRGTEAGEGKGCVCNSELQNGVVSGRWAQGKGSVQEHFPVAVAVLGTGIVVLEVDQAEIWRPLGGVPPQQQ